VGITVGKRLYEPEVDRLLRRAIDRPYVLIDCGANMGYWATSRANYEILTLNVGANHGRFVALHRAILDRSGQRVRLYGQRHYGMSVRTDWHPERGRNIICRSENILR
jgi:hypothetical protein